MTQNLRPSQTHKSTLSLFILFTQPESLHWLTDTDPELCGPAGPSWEKKPPTTLNPPAASCHGGLLSGSVCAQCCFEHGSSQITLGDKPPVPNGPHLKVSSSWAAPAQMQRCRNHDLDHRRGERDRHLESPFEL